MLTAKLPSHKWVLKYYEDGWVLGNYFFQNETIFIVFRILEKQSIFMYKVTFNTI